MKLTGIIQLGCNIYMVESEICTYMDGRLWMCQDIPYNVKIPRHLKFVIFCDLVNKIAKISLEKFFSIQYIVIANSIKCTDTKWQTARTAAYTETVANTGRVGPSGTETASMIVLYKNIITVLL